MMKMRGWFFSIAVLLLASCAQKPTRVFEGKDPEKAKQIVKEPMRPSLDEPLKITKDTIVIDARKPFNYSLAHIRRSVNIQPQEFNQKKAPFQGLLSNDLFFHTRRLARLGVKPDSDVLVVGQGKAGTGEEGRIAWALYYMGVRNVRYASIDLFRHGWTNIQNAKPYDSQPVWKPVPHKTVLATKAEVLKALTGSEGGYYKRSLRTPKRDDLVFVDVRSSREYAREVNKVASINIPWKDFFDEKGRPIPGMRKRLKDVGIQPSQRIIAISDKGVRSAAVTMALLDLGFENAANFAGGFQLLKAR